MTQFLTSQYWLAPQALTFTLNALGDPQKVAVSVSSGAMVMAYMPGVEGLGFDNAHSYRRWPVSGYASVLKDAVVTTTDAEGEPTDTIYPAIGEKYVYILIPRNAQSGSTALVGFAPCIIDYLGYTEEGVHIGTDQYYYLYIQGIISASVEGGNRTWQQDIVSGTLATEEAYSEGPDIPWYRWNALSQSVSFLKKIVMDAASWFSNLRTSSVQFVGNGTQDKGTLTSVADFGTISDSDTGAVVTTKYLADREEEIEKKYLRKDQDDETDYKLKMQFLEVVKKLTVDELSELNGILQNKDFSDSMTTGKSWGLFPSGRMQLESLEVRSSLKVLELIYNRLSAQESEFVFTESGTIEEITPNEDGTYTCKIERRNDTDFHAFKQGDVLRGVVNNLADLGGGEYFTSWMSIVDIDTTENNTITVSVYADKDVPSGSNTLPAQHMVVQRWGNNIVPSEDAHNNDDYKAFIIPSYKNDGTYINTRQACWYISSLEKRIVMLDGVNKPKLDNENYSAFFGLPFNFTNNQFKGHTMNPNQPYLYVRGAFLQDIHYIDYLGQIVRQERARGVWSSEIAGSDDPYVMNDSTYDTVYHENAKWQCAVELALYPPSLSNPEWVMLQEFTATTYTLIPSVSQIVRDIDGVPTPSVVTVDVIKQIGSGEPTYVTEEECQVYVGINQQMPYPLPSRRIDVPADAVTLEFYRFNKDSKLGEISFGDSIFSFLTNKVSVSIISKGQDGITPVIGTNGNWWINGVDTGLTSKGDDGHTPYIGDDGYWYEWNAETSRYEKTDTYAQGNSVTAQYSSDGEHWHYGFVVNDLYMRTSDDNGLTWSDTMKVVGEKGEGGDYIDTSFGISASLTNPSDVDTWADAPMNVTEQKPYLWMRQIKMVWDAASNSYKTSTEPSWRDYKYIRVTGEKGQSGNGISSVTEEYGVSANRNTLPEVWTTLEIAQNQWSALKPLLWNKETTSYTNGGNPNEKTHVIARWANDGRSITNIINWYKTSNNTTETAGKEDDGWSKDVTSLQFNAEKPYLWNYEEIIFDSGSPIFTDPAIKSIFSKGARGAVLRGPSEWNSTTQYQSGKDDEEYIDIVSHPSYPNELFLCKYSHSGVEPSADTIKNENWDALHPWTQSDVKEFVATKFLLSEQIKTDILAAVNAKIDDLVVKKLETMAQGGATLKIENGLMEVYGSAGVKNIEFGVDSDGYAVLKYFDMQGFPLYNLGPDGIMVQFRIVYARYVELQWIRSAENTKTTASLFGMDDNGKRTVYKWYEGTKTIGALEYYHDCSNTSIQGKDVVARPEHYANNEKLVTNRNQETNNPSVMPTNLVADGVYFKWLQHSGSGDDQRYTTNEMYVIEENGTKQTMYVVKVYYQTVNTFYLVDKNDNIVTSNSIEYYLTSNGYKR